METPKNNNEESTDYYGRKIVEVMNDFNGIMDKLGHIINDDPPEGIEKPSKAFVSLFRAMGTVANFGKIPAQAVPDTHIRKVVIPITLNSLEQLTMAVHEQNREYMAKAQKEKDNIKPQDIDALFQKLLIKATPKKEGDNGKENES